MKIWIIIFLLFIPITFGQVDYYNVIARKNVDWLSRVYFDAINWMPAAGINGIKDITTFAGVYNDSTNMETNAAAISVGLKWCSDNNWETYFPAGQYLIGDSLGQSPLNLYPNNIIKGDGITTIFYTDSASDTTITGLQLDYDDWVGADSTDRNLYISKITIIGKHPFDGTSGADPFIYNPGINIVAQYPILTMGKIIVRNCSIYNVAMEGIRVIGAKVAWIKNNLVSDTKFTGFTMLNERNYLINNTTDNTYTGVEAYTKSYWDNDALSYISGNTIGIGMHFGINAGGVDSIIIINNTITGDTAAWDNFSGILVRSGHDDNVGTATLYEIDGNNIKLFLNGIKTDNPYLRDSITQITINGNTLDSLYAAGIFLRDTSAQEYIDRTDITNNTITDWNLEGVNSVDRGAIYLYNYANSNQETYINNNTFYKNTDGWKSPLTLRITDEVTFNDNECTMPSTREIWIHTPNTYLIQGNTGLPSPNAIYNWDTETYSDQTP